MSEEGVPVDLYIYDLTMGMAALLAPAIIGRDIEGVWHTSVVVYEREFYYGSGGVTSCAPGSTELGAPVRVERLGRTQLPFNVFVDYLQGLATTTYSGAMYHLLSHNCNHFSEEVAAFACGGRVPKYVLRQPDQLPPTLRDALAHRLQTMQTHNEQPVYASGVRHSRRDSPDYVTLNDQIQQARSQGVELERRRTTLAEKLARKERRKEKKRKKQQRLDGTGDVDEEPEEMAEAATESPALESGAGVAAVADDEPAGSSSRDHQRTPRYPPIVYKDIDVAHEFEQLCRSLEGVALSAEEQQSVEELRQFLLLGEGSWVLGDNFLDFIGSVLTEERLAGSRAACMRCLSAGALRDDVALVLHQDRRHHALLSYAHNVDRLPADEQRALLTFMVNLFENVGASEWLLYISEWEHDGQTLSNIRATTKVCVHGAVSEEPELRELGTALLYNIAGKEVKTVVFDEVCVELCMAGLQALQLSPAEEHLHRVLAALATLALHHHDVPALVRLVGPSPDAFRGASERCDKHIDTIMSKMQ